jgi:SWI/SNF-related matrix-associated actin-dependent regulator of chromatin subfamily B protein 1
MYNLGPGETLDNFSVHFGNRVHKLNVEARLARG